MKNIVLTSLFLLSSLDISAAIFEDDDRIYPREASALNYELSKSVPALIPETNIKETASGDYELIGKSYLSQNFCSSEKFSDESLIANCSASLVAPNKILTAAHCFTNNYSCDKYKIVFDYVDGNTNIARKDVYSCKSVIFEKFVTNLQGDDIALIELDRPVIDRKPLKVQLNNKLKVNDKLSMIGYPFGMSQKVVEVGRVLSVNPKTMSFDHNLDSFSVNSGGPIFNEKGVQVGVLVRGTGPNFTDDEARGCRLWGREGREGFASGNLLISLKPFLK